VIESCQLANGTSSALQLPMLFAASSIVPIAYSVRCVLFHDVCDAVTPFTNGLGVTLSCQEFEQKLQFLARYYNPVSLQDLLDARLGKSTLPDRPVHVTFDDAYASVAINAAPLCAKYRIPATFFVNARFIDNRALALDNLICYVVNAFGFEALQICAASVTNQDASDFASLAQVFGEFLPSLSLDDRKRFEDALATECCVRMGELPPLPTLYVTSEQLRSLANYGIEIGNHTFSHIHCRQLTSRDFDSEIDRNRTELEAITGRPVRAFSVPYGSRKDLPGPLSEHLRRSGYEAAFLVESAANNSRSDYLRLNRVSMAGATDAKCFAELEILPRLRTVRNVILRRN
jgi:peptidoglycan/xylan/chitin deacetylase (PgdA/CDA1 family)